MPTTRPELKQETPAKNAAKVRSGYLGHLVKVSRSAEDALLNFQNVEQVSAFRKELPVALEKFTDASKRYIETLTKPTDIQKEQQMVLNHVEEAESLLNRIESWLIRAKEHGSYSNQPSAASPVPSHTSNTVISEAEKKRLEMELELHQLVRRQDMSRKEQQLQDERDLLEAQEKLERASLEAKLSSENDTSGSQPEPVRSVTFADGTEVETWPGIFLPTSTFGNNAQMFEALNQQRKCAERNNQNVKIAKTHSLPPPTLSALENLDKTKRAKSAPTSTHQSPVRSDFNSSERVPEFQINKPSKFDPLPPQNYGHLPLVNCNNQRTYPVSGAAVQFNNGLHSQTGEWVNNTSSHFPPAPNCNTQPYYAPSAQRFDQIVTSLGEMANAFRQGNDLPKPDIKSFSGDPRDFHNFKHSFTTIVETKTTDHRLRLHYLIQYCDGVARKAIEHCAMFSDPFYGLNEAKAILTNTFGQTYDIIQAYKSPILKSPIIKSNDCGALLNLALEMRKCELALAQLGFYADINNSETLLRIVWKLPYHLQNKWVVAANDIFRSGREPNFGDLTWFIRSNAQLANTFYGRNIRRERPEPPLHRTSSTAPRLSTRTTMAASVGLLDKLPTHPSCLYCDASDHKLDDCTDFHNVSSAERFKFAASHKICHNCLLVGHLAVGCLLGNNCVHQGCRRKHNALFHTNSNRPVVDVNTVSGTEDAGVDTENLINAEEVEEETMAPMKELETSFNCNFARSDEQIAMNIVPVVVRSNGKETTTLALLDTGSDVTLCTQNLVNTLKLKGRPAFYNINTINNTGTAQRGVEVSLAVSPLDNSECIRLPKVWTVDKIPIKNKSYRSLSLASEWNHLQGIEFPTMPGGKVELLIGGDVPEAFWVIDQRIGGRKEPYAIKTMLGWSLMGPVGTTKQANVNVVSTDERLLEQVQAFWNSEFNERQALGGPQMSKNDCAALKMVQGSLIKSKGYKVGLPWREDKEMLCGNFGMALQRLRSLKRRLSRDDNLRQRYTETINGYLKCGYAREVPDKVLKESLSCLWFLPHHPVLNPEKPEKLRIVFDCAATYQGKSLNSSLYSGPDVTSTLLGVLLRFRKDRIALVGDIEAMFHQIETVESDRNKLSFLWWKNGNLETAPKTYQMKVHIFGATSSPFCANFCLRQTAIDHAGQFSPKVINTVLRSFYVDDCLCSTNTVESALDLKFGLTRLLQLGGFHITKWISNSREVMRAIPATDLAPSAKSINLETSDLPLDRALGVVWNTEKDTIGFKCAMKTAPFTRRGILSTVSSVYDPFGLVSPFLLKGKLILQVLTKDGISWDDPITDKVKREWNKWLCELPRLANVAIPRCIKPRGIDTICNMQLHHFCDASSTAFGAVSYLRVSDVNGNTSCQFLIGKSRLAPSKTQSIPRLELTAATLAVKLNALLVQEMDLKFDSVHYWTDSKTVLKYLRNESKRFHTFVANRISLIQSGSEVNAWRYVPSKENPADDATRGLKPSEFTSTSRWLNGPSFLVKPSSQWPSEAIIETLSTSDKEVRQMQTMMNSASLVPESLTSLIERYSEWNRLVRAVAWLARFKIYLYRGRNQSTVPQGPLSASELTQSEHDIILLIQQKNFSDFFVFKEVDYNKLPKSIRKLRPFVCKGVLRVGGRLSQAPVSYDLKHPIIIPKGHVANLLIRNEHRKNGHVGPSHTWTQLRQRFWIMAGGAAIRKEIGKCVQCKRRNAKPCTQLMGDLPELRVTPNKPPFSATGVDYFGPLVIRQGRSAIKRYGCLFTCLSSRAIHIEVAADLSASSFINAFKRFVSRRGCPTTMFSDNGGNFVGAEKEICNAKLNSDDNQLQNYFASKRITWKFNSPLAPHMGGVWERMVGIVKKILKAILQEQLINDDVLHTTLLEVESIVNSRPLIPVTLDPAKEEPLSPNHLLLLNTSNCNMDHRHYNKSDNYSTRRWRQVQYLSLLFWRRWVKEYLPLLNRRDKWNQSQANIQIGDVVVTSEESVPRGRWPLAKVVETYPGKDGRVRQVKIKIKDTTYIRPVTKLYKIID